MPDDVIPAPSAGGETPLPTEPAAPSGVTDVGDVVVDDRPLKNVQAEFNRKLGKVESQISELATMIQQALAPKPAPAQATSWDQYSNEQLAQLAQAGSAEAQLKLAERLATTQVQAQVSQATRAQTVQATHQSLYARYKQLNDPSHPLTQYAMRVKGALLQQGYSNSMETDVEAIKTAIVDNPQLVTAQVESPTEPARRAAAQVQSGIDGNTQRRVPAPAPKVPTLSPAERALATRMNVRDPEGSKARFQKRQEEGKSALGAVGLHVRES